MCGIVGYVSLSDAVHPKDKRKFMQDALVLDTFRGQDSTGMLTVCEDGKVRSHKALGVGWNFIQQKKVKALPMGWAAIGHNRAATTGSVSLSNAHPFKSGPVTLVHNGTLDNMGSNLPNFCKEGGDVDSMQIARALGHVAPEDAVELVLKHIKGAYALAWVDTRDQSVNIVRNGSRPLHFTHDSAKSVLWFMSDGRHLNMLKKRNWATASMLGQIWQFDTHQFLKWKAGSLMPEVIKYDPFVAPYVHPVYNNAHRSGYGEFAGSRGNRWWQSVGTGGTNAGTEPSTLGLPATASLSHRMYVNGVIDKVPQHLLNDLKMVTDLTPDDLLEFKPDTWTPYPHNPDGHQYGMVEGTVWVEDWNCDWACVVHHVPERLKMGIHDDLWLVHPMCTTEQTTQDEYSVAILARFKEMNYKKPEAPPFTEEDDDTTDFVIGPNEQHISTDKWLELTKYGCGNCSKTLDLSQADDIWWVGEGNTQPMCDDCCSITRQRIMH